ncbi:hypothetical protein AVEN_112832-1 [Araneus ventricosus]|uniref:Uncharacterized protein n=1 Tax=Araneus ventricosus TaxID=182803 RepID=A0A4Y2NHJ3_ARAVE|nr:hypothetical protein AVEN_112832-1 [Araneus ventricosus]
MLTSPFIRGRGGLVVRSRPRDKRVIGLKPDSTEDPPSIKPVVHKIIHNSQTSSHWCGVEVWRGECQFRCHPHHLPAVQNYEVRP